MVKKLCFIVLMLTSGLSFSAAPVPHYSIAVGGAIGNTGLFPTREETCAEAGRMAAGQANGSDRTYTGEWAIAAQYNPPRCGLKAKKNVDPSDVVTRDLNFSFGVPRCVPGATLPDTTKPLADQCGTPPPCVAGNKQTFAVPAENLPASVCNGYCTWTNTGQTAVFVNDSWFADYTSTASSCTTNTPLLPSEPQKCPKGTHNASNSATNLQCVPDDPKPPTCWAGSTNISTDPTIAICIDNSPPEPEEPEGEEPTPDGPPTKKTDTTKTKNADGSETTTTTTTTSQKYSNGTTSITTEITQITKNPDGTIITKVTEGGSEEPDEGEGGGSGIDDLGSPAGLGGELYTKKDDTFASVMQTFKQTVEAAPAIAAANNFFVVSVGGGGCPSWSVSVPYLNVTADVGQYFCGSLMSGVFGIIGAGLMLGASYVAFRWAFL